MHAYALEILRPPLAEAFKRGEVPKALDIGSGSGYLSAAMARMYDADVVGIEHIKELYEMSMENLKVNIRL